MMNDEYKVSLGATAVLDPEHLKEGDNFFLDSRLVIVDRIVDDKVFLRLATQMERLKFYHKRRSRLFTCLLIAALVAFIALYFEVFRHVNLIK
jgi:hypothetical protein